LNNTPDFKYKLSKQIKQSSDNQSKPKQPEPEIIKPTIEPKPSIKIPSQPNNNNDIISLCREGLLSKDDFMTLMGAKTNNTSIKGCQ